MQNLPFLPGRFCLISKSQISFVMSLNRTFFCVYFRIIWVLVLDFQTRVFMFQWVSDFYIFLNECFLLHEAITCNLEHLTLAINIFKLGIRNVHHERNKMTPTILLPWQHHWLQSLSVKNQISLFATFLSRTGGLPWNRHGSHIVLILPIRWLLGVDDPCVRWNLRIVVVMKTGPVA